MTAVAGTSISKANVASGAGGVDTALALPIDHAHLARYTLGNRALELEVLQLFAGQAPLTLGELRAAASAKSWHIAAHTLKGSARAVGACAVARAAEQAERGGPHELPSEAVREGHIERLEAAIAESIGYIAGLPAMA